MSFRYPRTGVNIAGRFTDMRGLLAAGNPSGYGLPMIIQLESIPSPIGLPLGSANPDHHVR